MRTILVGPPGSGKGTQARLLSERLGLVQIGTGDILREAIRLGTPHGVTAEPYVKNGKLVPDALVNDLVADLFRREDRPTQFVMDGYPRTLAQAVAFDQVLRQQFLNLCAVCRLMVDDEEIVRRLSGRRSCPNCHATYHIYMKPPKVPGICDVCGHQLIQREDDNEATIRRRLGVFHKNVSEMIPHYQAQGLYHEVPGEGTVEKIHTDLVAILKQAGPKC
ncbi:MAG: adenylate kinase [Planctomycetes bacterium]|nr:adenylate kinase [Planctomycetota bacterium]